MKDSQRKPKLTLESLIAQGQVITGKDLIKREEDKVKEAEEFAKAAEFESRNKRVKRP